MPALTAYDARPTILIDGQANASLNTDALSVLVEETTDGLYRCEACFSNFGPHGKQMDYLYFGRDILDFGKDFAVELGAGNRAGRVFAGRITGLEGEFSAAVSSQIIVLAEDRLQALRMTRRTRSFEDVSDADILRQIAGEHSLTPQLDMDGPTHKSVAQVNLSDLAFIRERARSVGVEVWVDGTTLYAKARAGRSAGTINLEYAVNLIAFSVRADLAEQCSEVGVSGWDVAAKDGIAETADASAISAELSGDVSGTSILESALAPRKERVVHRVPLTSAEARGLAQARYRERARRFVTGSGTADGDARIRVGTTVSITGVGNLFNGNYYVARVRHTYDGTYGYRTEFDVERPGLGRA
jgi:phage protein D